MEGEVSLIVIIMDMVIEITKRNFFIVGVVIILAAALFYFGYTVGYNKGYDRAISNTENVRGDGTNFYAEEKTKARTNLIGQDITHDYIIYHSIPNCKAIENGVSKNKTYSDSTYRENNSVFCPKCMNDYLIELCEAFLQYF